MITKIQLTFWLSSSSVLGAGGVGADPLPICEACPDCICAWATVTVEALAAGGRLNIDSMRSHFARRNLTNVSIGMSSASSSANLMISCKEISREQNAFS
jgi:hypothetical protein